MKRIGFTVAALAAVLARTGFAQQACVTADSSCKESFAVGQFSFWYYRSFPLQAPNPNITRAAIVIHGMNRNASDSFQTVVTALNNAGDPSLLVIAPHFKGSAPNSPACNDSLEPGELHWSCAGPGSVNRWDDGGQALDAGGDVIYSFAMIDRLLDTLNNATLFPNLRKITITGHSEGGEFTQRYAAGNLKDGAISPSVKYVIANPGAYMYLDNGRLPQGETCSEDGTCTAQITASADPAACPDSYNSYTYGLDNRSYGYMSSNQPGFTDAEVRGGFYRVPWRF